LSSLPVINYAKTGDASPTEGKFSREGGGLESFDQRVESMQEMNQILDACFEGKQRIDVNGFKKINEEISSDSVLAIKGLFRERLPCSENFWRYKRNYDLHMKMMNNSGRSEGTGRSSPTTTKKIAFPQMKHVRVLSPYSRW